jgi:hypothetical protein
MPLIVTIQTITSGAYPHAEGEVELTIRIGPSASARELFWANFMRTEMEIGSIRMPNRINHGKA